MATFGTVLLLVFDPVLSLPRPVVGLLPNVFTFPLLVFHNNLLCCYIMHLCPCLGFSFFKFPVSLVSMYINDYVCHVMYDYTLYPIMLYNNKKHPHLHSVSAYIMLRHICVPSFGVNQVNICIHIITQLRNWPA